MQKIVHKNRLILTTPLFKIKNLFLVKCCNSSNIWRADDAFVFASFWRTKLWLSWSLEQLGRTFFLFWQQVLKNSGRGFLERGEKIHCKKNSLWFGSYHIDIKNEKTEWWGASIKQWFGTRKLTGFVLWGQQCWKTCTIGNRMMLLLIPGIISSHVVSCLEVPPSI